MNDPTKRATIMVVDDEGALRELLVLALVANGFDAIGAANTKQTLACLQSRDVDVLLLDLALGSESGIDLLRAIRRLPKYETLPVILLTGCKEKNTVLEIANLGIQGCVLKSHFSRDDLVARINRQLANREPTPQFSCAQSAERRGSSISTSVAARPTPGGDPQAIDAADPEFASAIPDSLRSLRPIITREQIFEKIDKCSELKAISPTVAQLMSMTTQSGSSLEEIAQVIKLDQAIALKVLTIANSVAYNRGGSVDTMQKALLRIGISQIRQVVLNISVIDNFQKTGKGGSFNSEAFWEHAIAAGLIAAAITRSRQADESAIDKAYTLGFLHDVARLVFVEQLGDIYQRVVETAARLQLPLEQVESRMLGLNHADLMDRVLNAWKFPRSLVEPIAMHHLSVGNIRVLSPEMVDEASTLALANRLAHALLLGSSGNHCQYPTDEFAQFLKLEPGLIQFIEKKIPEQTMDMKYAMLQSGSTDASPDYRASVLNRFHQPIRPLYISANPTFDGYRILFERLAEPAGDEKPNVVILHLADMSDRESLFKTLQENENRAGVDLLPLIIISPFATAKLEPAFLTERTHRSVPSPFALSRLAEAVNSLCPRAT
jgi:HD-like signal output (HDOD) protein/DNA-binding response OmpR family regulator